MSMAKSASGLDAITGAASDVVSGTVEDVKALPRAPGAVAAFPSKKTLIPLLLAQFINSYDTSSMNVAITNIAHDLGTTVTMVQTALSLYTLIMAAGMITGSKLSDIFGRRRMLTIGVGTYGVGALITALSPTIGVMLLGWSMLEGIGSCLMIPPIYILVTVNYKDLKARAAAFGAVGAAAALGGASGPLLGGIITTAVSWRLSFALESLVVVTILLLRGRIIDARVVTEKPKLDIGGAALSAIGMAGIVCGLLLVGNYGFLTCRRDFSINGQVLLKQGQISPAIISIVLGLLFVLIFGWFELRKERRGEEPLVRMAVVLNRIAATGLTTQAAQWLLSTGGIFLISLYLQVTYGFSAIKTGVVMIPSIIGLMLFSRRSAKLARKFPVKGILLGGFIITEIGLLLLFLLVDPNGSAWRFVPGLLFFGSGIGIIMPASVNVVQSSASEEQQSDISGVSRSISNFGSSFGVALAGAVLISSLITGITTLTNESTVLPRRDKQQIEAALQKQVTALSDAQVQEALKGKPQYIVNEVVNINAEARNRAMSYALLSLGIAGLFGIVATVLVPGRARRTSEERARGSLDESEAASDLSDLSPGTEPVGGNTLTPPPQPTG